MKHIHSGFWNIVSDTFFAIRVGTFLCRSEYLQKNKFVLYLWRKEGSVLEYLIMMC